MNWANCSKRYENFKHHCKKFIQKTSIKGLKHVFLGNSIPRRIIWGFIFSLCSIGCIVVVGFSFRRFFARPTATTIIVRSTPEDGLAFPAVTFCNLNRKRNLSDELNNQTHQLLYYLFSPDQTFSTTRENTSSIVDQCYQDNLDNLSEIWNYIIREDRMNNFIHYCGFSIGPDSDTIDCKNSIQPVLTSAGICYTFNGNNNEPNKNVKRTGVRFGLKLILNIDSQNSPSPDGNSGVKVIVHERNYIPHPNLYGIGVPPGRNGLIGVRKRTEIDETVEAHCTDGFNLPFLSDVVYSQFACLQNALLTHAAESCSCAIHSGVRPSSGHYANLRECTFNDSCCLIDNFDEFNEVAADCPLPCNFTYYSLTDSYVSFPSGSYLDNLVETFNKSADTIKEDFLAFQVFLEDIQVTTSITKYTFTWDALLADIGGQMGLFIGFGIISAFEVLVLILDILKDFLFPKKLIEVFDKELEDVKPELEVSTEF
jgi:acid-sensing ion channel 5